MRLPSSRQQGQEEAEAGARRQVRELIAHCTVVAELALRMSSRRRP